jgi:anaerobic selenocysteine-containing dehydrogenase/Fe-S-cluster-containing dehydrogenase component
MANLSRRDFLKIAGLTGSAALAGCSEPTRRLIPYVIPPEDLIPGEATWYATTCRECPAGCGMLAKNRDGHIIKVEGNPNHPINHGRLCPRGQASVQGLYNPERFRGPLRRNSLGFLDPITWEEAESELIRRLSEVSRQGGKGRVVFLSELITATPADLARRWVATVNGELILYEPYSYEALRKANQIVFDADTIPFYHIERADFLISFNAPFLETWLSNVEYTWHFANFHAATEGRKNLFLWVGPRFSLTAASADEWIATQPGTEYLVALGLLKILEGEGLAQIPNRDSIRSMAAPFSLDAISQTAGVQVETLRAVARLFAGAKSPLVLSGGLTTFDPNAVATAVASNLLCTAKPGTHDLIDFNSESSYSAAVSSERMRRLIEQMGAGEIDTLIIHGANPVFTLPKSWNFRSALKRVPFIVSLSTYQDETSRLAHLVLPTHHFLESWGEHTPRKGITGLIQPAMGNLFNTRNLGDILISTGKQISAGQFPWEGMYQRIRESWGNKSRSSHSGPTAEAAWEKALESGGEWGPPASAKAKAGGPRTAYSFPKIEAAAKTSPSDSVYSFVTYPTVQFFDGRMANRLWIQELPDPITMTTWGGWIEIHHETAKRMDIKDGDLVRLQSPYGYVDGPALPFFTVPARTVAMPVGQGHTGFGGYSDGLPANPLDLFPPGIDPASGGIQGPSFQVTLSKLKGTFPIAHTDGYFYQRGRKIAQAVQVAEYRDIINRGIKPEIRMPLSEGFKKKIDFYPAHHHDQYRWAMAIDLDRCIGCGACVVACYAENNVPVVGRKEILHQREMSWLRVERYFDRGTKVRVHYLPVPCQHCDEAPCESVCPVFAPNHSKEGINNQVYNRCIGTRDCSQNCPYKVRRFNFFSWKNPEPMQWQYNPDVTVRQKGVMEKCSFCIQRVVQAKTVATSEGRLVRDGEFTTACAQTCPANAITFGNLKDPNSRVAKLFQDPRAYQLLYELNTKPGVVYLKKVVQDRVV